MLAHTANVNVIGVICFLIFISLLIGILCRALHNNLRLRQKEESKSSPARGSIADSIIINTMPSDGPIIQPSSKADVPSKVPEKKAAAGPTLDELFAASHNMWVCGFCETINKNGSDRCIVCGHGKNE